MENTKAILEKIRRDPNNVFTLKESDYKNEEIMYYAVGLSGYNLKYCSKKLKNNERIVLHAINTTSSVLEYASCRIRKNPEIVLKAVNLFSSNIKFAHKSLLKDKDFMMQALLKSGHLLKFASDELKDDLEIVFQAVTNNSGSIVHSSSRWRSPYMRVYIKDKSITPKDFLQKFIDSKNLFDSLENTLKKKERKIIVKI